MGMDDRIQFGDEGEGEGFSGFSDPDELLNAGRELKGETTFKPDLTFGRAKGAVVEELKAGVRDRLIGVGLVDEMVEDRARAFRTRRAEELKALQKKTGQAKRIKRDEEFAQYKKASTDILAAAASERLAADPSFEISSGFIEDQIRSLTQVGQQVLTAGVAGPVVAMGDMGLMITGGSYDRFVKMGADPERARTAAFANAVVQSPLEYLGISKVTKLLKPQKQSIRLLKRLGEIAGTEGLTEYIQNIGPEKVAELWALNPDKNVMNMWDEELNRVETHTEALKGAGHAALSSVIIGGAGAHRQVKREVTEEKIVNQAAKELEAAALEAEAAKELSPHEEARLARKIAKAKARKEKPSAKKPKPKKPVKAEPKKEEIEKKPEVTEEPVKAEKKPEDLTKEEIDEMSDEDRARVVLGEEATDEDVSVLAEQAKTAREKLAKRAKHGKVTPGVVEKLPPKGKTGVIPEDFEGETISVETDKVPAFAKLTKVGILQEDGTIGETIDVPALKGAASSKKDKAAVADAVRSLSGQGKGEVVFVDTDGKPHTLEEVAAQKVVKDTGATTKEELKAEQEEDVKLGEKRAKAPTNKQILKETAEKPLNKKQEAEFNQIMTKVRGAARRMSKANNEDYGDLVNTSAIDVLAHVRKSKSKRPEKYSAGFAVKNALNTIRARGMGSRRQAGKIKTTALKGDEGVTQEFTKGGLAAVTTPQEEVRTKSALEQRVADVDAKTELESIEAEAKNLGIEVGATPALTLENINDAIEESTGKELTARLALRKRATGTIVADKKFVLSELPKRQQKGALEEMKRVMAAEKDATEKARMAERIRISEFQKSKPAFEPKVSIIEGREAKGTGFITGRTEAELAQAKSREAIGISAETIAKAPGQFDPTKTELEGTAKGNPWRSKAAADRALLARSKKDTTKYRDARVIKVTGKKQWQIEVRQEFTGRVVPDKPFVEPISVGKWRSVDQAIAAIDKSRKEFDLAVAEALKQTPGTKEHTDKIEAMQKRVEKRQKQIARLELKYPNAKNRKNLAKARTKLQEQMSALEDSGLVSTVGNVLKNERGGMEINLPGRDAVFSLPRKIGEAWTAKVDEALARSGQKIRQVATTSSGIDTVLTGIVTKFGLDPTFRQLEKDKKQSNHTMNVLSTRISKAIERIDDVFDFAQTERVSGVTGEKLALKARRAKVGEKAKQRRLKQIAEGGITAFGDKTVALRLATKEFQKMEKELRSRGMLKDHQFRQLNRRERAKALSNPASRDKNGNIIGKREDFGIAELEQTIDELRFSSLDQKKIDKAIKKLEEQRKDIIARLQIHYKNSGVNYLRYIEGQLEQNERYMKRFTLDAMSNKWSKRRQNWKTSVDKETGIVTVRRPKPSKKSLKKVHNVADMVQKGLSQEAHDLHLFDLYSNIAKSEEDFEFTEGGATAPWATTDPNQYPDTEYVQMPNNSHFGPLAGMYLEKHIYADMKTNIEEVSNFTRGVRKVFRNWKAFKTVWNPATQTRNFLSNIALADVVGDVNFLKKSTYIAWNQAFKDFNAVSKGLTPGSKYGQEILNQTTIHENTFQQAELGENDYITRLGEAFADVTGPVQLAKFVRAVAKSGPTAYQMMEVTMKSVVYSAARERGESIQEAADIAERALFNYSEVPPGIRWARNYYQPFVTFTYKAAPAVARAVIRKPWKMVKYYGLVYGAQALAGIMLDEDEEEMEMKKRNLPDYMDRDMLPGMPSHIRMPFQSPDGKDKYLDLSFILPWGALNEMGEGPLSWVPQALLPNTPLLTVPAALLTNTDVFTLRPISLDTDSAGTKIWKVFSKVAKEAAPGVIDPSKMSKILGAFYGDKNFQGQKNYSVADATLDWALGIKLRNMDYMEQSMWRQKDLQKKIVEIKSEYKKQYIKIMVTQEERFSGVRQKAIENIQREFNDKMEDVIEEQNYRFMRENDNE
jgi:hypothetical protein